MRLAREWALLQKYALQLGGDPFGDLDEELAELLEWPVDEGGKLLMLEEDDLRGIADNLAYHAGLHSEELDELIQSTLANWRIDRLERIIRIILCLALAEFRRHKETPYRVILNEYIEITKDFGSQEAARFVNGVLDKLARDLRSDEIEDESSPEGED